MQIERSTGLGSAPRLGLWLTNWVGFQLPVILTKHVRCAEVCSPYSVRWAAILKSFRCRRIYSTKPSMASRLTKHCFLARFALPFVTATPRYTTESWLILLRLRRKRNSFYLVR